MKRTISMLVVLFLTGCATVPEAVPPALPYVGVPKALTVRCPQAELIHEKEYMAKDRDGREEYLMGVIKYQGKVTAKCNTQFQAIESWDDEQRKLHEGK